MSVSYLWDHADHLKRWRHVESRWDTDMAEVYSECFTPDTKVANVKHCEVSWQGENYRLPVVPPQWYLLPVFVRHSDTLRAGSVSSPHPELCICNK